MNTEAQKDIASAYNVTTLPTFIIIRNGKVADKVQGANPVKLQSVIKKLVSEVENIGEGSGSGSASASGATWRGADVPRNYTDITGQIELKRCELLNFESQIGGVNVLFEAGQPSALSSGKGTANDWVESDTDEQLLLFMPFQSMVKLHTLQVRGPRRGLDMLPGLVTDTSDRSHLSRPRTTRTHQ